MRSAVASVVLAIAFCLAASSAPAQNCPGDCNANGSLSASDFGRMQTLILRCSTCNGKSGAAIGGCAQAGGCANVDLNEDGCFTAAEFSFFLRKGIDIGPVEPGQCRIDARTFPGYRPKPCDCNEDGIVGASDLGRVLSLTAACKTCPDGSPGAPINGCTGHPQGCRAADPDRDGCIRANEVDRICSGSRF